MTTAMPIISPGVSLFFRIRRAGHLSVYRLLSLTSTRTVNTNLTHYQVLGVEKDASSESIRDAFIELSKISHPDINSEDPQNHAKFVQINEAYSVLSKPLLRREYDNNLKSHQHSRRYQQHYSASGNSSYNQSQQRPFYDPQFYANRDKSQDKYNEGQPYYGVQGISKVSNKIIVYICLGVVVIGAIFHFTAVKMFSDVHIETLNSRDKRSHEIWKNAKDPGHISKQKELMKIKIEEMEKEKERKRKKD